MKSIYLAGPILGKTKTEAKAWKQKLVQLVSGEIMSSENWESYETFCWKDPLRCEPLIGDTYETHYDDPKFGTAKAISAKNWYDVSHADLIVAYMPAEMGDAISLGTLVEMAWANALGKTVILVSDHPKINAHPIVDRIASWKLTTLEEAAEVIVGLASWEVA